MRDWICPFCGRFVPGSSGFVFLSVSVSVEVGVDVGTGGERD